jgi:hypothetical protein
MHNDRDGHFAAATPNEDGRLLPSPPPWGQQQALTLLDDGTRVAMEPARRAITALQRVSGELQDVLRHTSFRPMPQML